MIRGQIVVKTLCAAVKIRAGNKKTGNKETPSREYACKASRSNKRSKKFDKKPKRRQATSQAAGEGQREHAVS